MKRHEKEWLLAVAAAVGAWLVLAFSAPGIPIVWDEGEYLVRAKLVFDWFRLLVHVGSPQGGLHALSAPVIKEHWLFITYAEGHPDWFAIPIAFGHGLLSRFLNPLTAARLGPITVFSLACGAVAFRLKRNYGTTAALVAPIALVTFPRMFSEAHFATLDGQLTAWWLMLWVGDTAFQSGTRSAFGVGALLGLTSATKFTGWMAWPALIASRAFRKDPARWRALLIILPAALLTFCCVNPPLWHDPISGLTTFFHLNLDRSNTFNIPVAFFGRIYDAHHSLPWYNTIAWLLLVTPLPTLALGLIGLVHSIRKRDATSVALVLHWAMLMVIRALPGAPPHDGIRLFLPAFGFWCVLAGVGAQRAWDAVSSPRFAWWPRTLVRAAIVVSLGATAVNLARYYPQTLSHYNLLAGGVRGAAQLGMEPTYWWDALDNDVLTWINNNTDPAAAVAFSPISNLTLLREWGRLRTRTVGTTEPFKWYVLQNRTGMLTDIERALMRDGKPAYVKYPGRHPAGRDVPEDLRTPLILIYSYEDYTHALAARWP